MSNTNPCPPDDNRKWITSTEAAAMLKVTINRLLAIAKEQAFTTCRTLGARTPRYYLYSEIESLAEFRRLRRTWTRKYQISGRLPRYVEKMDANDIKTMADSQKFVTRKEAAAILGVSQMMISDLVYRGRLVAYQTNPGQRGSKMWFSRRAVLQLKEDPDRLKAQQVQRGEYQAAVTLATGQGVKKARHPQKVSIPPHLMTIAEAAQRLGLNRSTIHDLRKRGRLHAEKLWRYNKPIRYWYILVTDVDRLLEERAERNQQKTAQATETLPAAAPTAFPLRSSTERHYEDTESAPEPRWACDEKPNW